MNERQIVWRKLKYLAIAGLVLIAIVVKWGAA